MGLSAECLATDCFPAAAKSVALPRALGGSIKCVEAVILDPKSPMV